MNPDLERLQRYPFQKLTALLDVEAPAGGFYFWPKTPLSDTEFTRRLYSEQALSVLPGSYLAREARGTNPGTDRVRIGMVPPLAECVEAARRIRALVESL